MKQIADIKTAAKCPDCGEHYQLRVSVAEKNPPEGEIPNACSSMMERRCGCDGELGRYWKPAECEDWPDTIV